MPDGYGGPAKRGRRERSLERGEVFPVIQDHVGVLFGSTEYVDHGVVVYVPTSVPEPRGLSAALAALDAGGCAVALEALDASDARGRWRVTVTHPGWPSEPGRP